MPDMPSHPVVLIDTSVFLELLRVPGMSERHEELQKEFLRLHSIGARFILPVTTIIETGNHISQCSGDRRAAAKRFHDAIDRARSSNPPWAIRETRWNEEFFAALLEGDSTGMSLVDHFSGRSLGAGDLAILVERDLFIKSSAFTDVRVWTIDEKLDSYS